MRSQGSLHPNRLNISRVWVMRTCIQHVYSFDTRLTISGAKKMRATTKILTALTLTLFACPAFADTAPRMDGMPRLAIGGYDTVAYFTVGVAVPGSLHYQTVWHDARWHSPIRRTSLSSSPIQRNMRLNMMVIAPWASPTRTATKIQSIPRLSRSSTVSCM